ncbi:MAG: flagellar basal body L-ring protein FlgH [Pseudomonadota bacterium]
MRNRFWIGIAAVTLTACNGQLESIGRPPPMSAPGAQAPIIDPPIPQRVALAPAPPPRSTVERTASLWQSGPKSLFGDRRARAVGDILTVLIEIEDEAEITNSTSRARAGDDNVNVSAAYGLTGIADVILPGGNTLSPGVQASGSQTSTGDGQISREEEITLRLAATVQRVLPNGHLAIRGSQEVRVNFELRDLQIAGIVRPEDISRQNVITYDKIADARIVYGGRGQLTNVQQPRYGQQVVDFISPF